MRWEQQWDIGVDNPRITEGVAGPEFIRGDMDGGAIFNGLVDALHGLAFQFIPGSPPPPCLKAADTDDDGTFNGLVDPIAALNFQFIPGSPPPPSPYPTCGPDPTDDPLSCGTPPICP